MDRRSFLRMSPQPRMAPVAPRQVESTLAGYAGPWTREQAAHLARRSLFGPTNPEVEALTGMGMSAAVASVLSVPVTPPSPPVNSDFTEVPEIPVGTTWVDKFNYPNTQFRWRKSLRSWWVNLMLQPSGSILEKMTLFWQNHFGVSMEIVTDARFAYRHLDLLRTHALGNVKQLVQEMTIDPAMLRFLNGNVNVKGAPNENYARELLELFTIGKGPQIAPGNYTYYTEDDVVAAAKVLTGWRDRGNFSGTIPVGVEFRANQHDVSTKAFSAAFNNHTISDAGDQEYKLLVDMIFQQAETARYLCRKLYRWFVHYDIDSQIEQDVIEPMANILISNNFDVLPVLSALFSSEHFYDPHNIGGLIKTPVDFFLSPLRQLNVAIPDPAIDLAGHYDILFRVFQLGEQCEMSLLAPPSVAGWPAYYQEPQFHQLWANSATLPVMTQYARDLVGKGVKYKQKTLLVDPLPWLDQVSDPFDPNVVVAGLVALLLPQPLAASQLDFLKDTLIPGLPDYEWGIEYGKYKNDPTNTGNVKAVANKLSALMEATMGLPEFLLS